MTTQRPDRPVTTHLPRLLDMRDTQAALGGVSRRTVERLIADQKITALRIAGRRMIREDSIAALIESAA